MEADKKKAYAASDIKDEYISMFESVECSRMNLSKYKLNIPVIHVLIILWFHN